MRLYAAIALLSLAACTDDAAVPPGSGLAAPKTADSDGDGDPDATDCDDTDSAVFTGAAEVCNAGDDDCDGVVDDNACACTDDTDGDHAFLYCETRSTWADAQAACASWGYHLADVESAAEGAWIWGVAEALDPDWGWWHGGNDRGVEGSWAWDGGATSTYTDWRAAEPNDYGGAEDCGLFADNGSGAWNDKGCTTTLPYVCEAGCLWSEWHDDVDGDGFGDADALTRACTAPAGTVADATDCDDGDPSVSPDEVEVCGGGDEDCDGLVDDADASVSAASLGDWYADVDGDGAGAGVATASCTAPAGYVADGADCDDGDATILPGAPDRPADGIDQDCDGADGCTWYLDTDGDGHGDATAPYEDCGAPSGYAVVGDDCDDTDGAVFPGAVEAWYDGVDGDCSGGSDDDADADGVDDLAHGGVDCDDTDATTFPGADEACDGADNDCDGGVDSDASGTDVCPVPVATYDDHTYLFLTTRTDWVTAQAACAAYGYHLVDVRDAAEDAWLWAEAEAADPATGWWMGLHDADTEGVYTWDGGSPASYTNWRPGEPNDYAGAEDCGAWADDGGGGWNDKSCVTQSLAFVCEAGCEPVAWYTDGDGDGHGDATLRIEACDAPVGTAAVADDCDDSAASVSPSAVEVCDAADTDEDCDGLADDADPTVDPASYGGYWADADGDGYGDITAPVGACDPVAGASDWSTDCDDTDSDVFPGAPERDNGRDDDCDGATEFYDPDGDGLASDVEDRIGTDPEDADSDGDGLLDGLEVPDASDVPDTDGDGDIDPLDADDDGDRLTTRAEIGEPDLARAAPWPEDIDRDGLADHLDLDTDDDSVPDGEDALLDTDRDGILNVEDPDDDGDGLPTALEAAADAAPVEDVAPDADGDGFPNHLDEDSDDDGCIDGFETDGVSDTDVDGLLAFVDPDECAPPRGPAEDDTGAGDTAAPPLDTEPCGCVGAPGGPGTLALAVAAALASRRRRRS
ncbi:MAG: MopE-related protein [Pseudomonadota bacterium]|nr:MopE-related protein [Pseudomonadota bacterium]